MESLKNKRVPSAERRGRGRGRRDLCVASSARSITEMIFLDIKVLPRTADNMTRGRFIEQFNVTLTVVTIISLYCRRRKNGKRFILLPVPEQIFISIFYCVVKLGAAVGIG